MAGRRPLARFLKKGPSAGHWPDDPATSGPALSTLVGSEAPHHASTHISQGRCQNQRKVAHKKSKFQSRSFLSLGRAWGYWGCVSILGSLPRLLPSALPAQRAAASSQAGPGRCGGGQTCRGGWWFGGLHVGPARGVTQASARRAYLGRGTEAAAESGADGPGERGEHGCGHGQGPRGRRAQELAGCSK